MKPLLLFVVLAFGTGHFVTLCKAEPVPAIAPSPDSKTRAGIGNAESRLGNAIEKRDLPALAALLAESYSDSYDGSEKALAKSGALAWAKAGRLANFRIEKEIVLAQTHNTVSVEGLARDERKRHADLPESEEWLRVRRVWAFNDGHWLLLSQVRFRKEEDHRSGDKD